MCRLHKLNASIHDLFPLPVSKKPFKQFRSWFGFPVSTSLRGICKWPWRRQIFQKPPLVLVCSSSLYEFTHMPFGLTNSDVSFCRLMEMCIGNQQYFTLLFYLDDICVFVETADQMLDRIELVFSRLKEFHLKIKPKKSYFFQTSMTFLRYILSANGVLLNPEKVTKVKDWPVPKNAKEVHSFIRLASYYHRVIPNYAKWAGPLHTPIMPASFKQKSEKGK